MLDEEAAAKYRKEAEVMYLRVSITMEMISKGNRDAKMASMRKAYISTAKEYSRVKSELTPEEIEKAEIDKVTIENCFQQEFGEPVEVPKP